MLIVKVLVKVLVGMNVMAVVMVINTRKETRRVGIVDVASQARQTFGSGVVHRYCTARGRRIELYTAWQ